MYCKIVALFFMFGCVVGDECIGRRKVVPVLYVRGTHYEIGFDMGRNFESIIKDFIATSQNLRDFEREYNTVAGREAYDKTLANMNKRFPYYVKEIQGIADGAKVPFYKLFLLHMDDLIGTANGNNEPRNDTGGCTDIGIINDQYTLLGHTEDAFRETVNHFYIVSAHVLPSAEDLRSGATEERFSSLCYAGQLPGYTMQHNEYGLVATINTLSPRQLKYGNTPRTFITRKLLSAKSLSQAVGILKDDGLGIGNGFSVNMIWSDPWGHNQLYNAEVAPDPDSNKSRLHVLHYDKEPLVHVNLYRRLKVKEVIGPIIDSSEARMTAIARHPPPKTREDIEDILSDTSGRDFQIFQDKKSEVINTIAIGIFDLEQRSWNIYINKPNASEPLAVLPIRFTGLYTDQ